MQDEQIRAFIAIELPPDLKSRLKEFQSQFIMPRHTFVKWVSPDSVHLTLKFLGNVTSGQVEKIMIALKAISVQHATFKLHTLGTGCFPNLKRARVFWLGLGGDLDRLSQLHSSIDAMTGKLGFAVENRPYTAHLTLARVKDECTASQRWEFSEVIRGALFEPEYDMEISSIALMRSNLTPGGAIYSRLGEFKLNK